MSGVGCTAKERTVRDVQNRGAALVVGGDRPGSVMEGLRALGYDPVLHERGRGRKKVPVPAYVRLVVVLIDQCSHALMECVRDQCKRQEMPAVFARTSWPAVYRRLQQAGA